MLRTDFLADRQVCHRDYDGPRAVNLRAISSSETVIKVIAVVAALFLLLASFLTGNPIALLVMLPVTVIGCGLTIRYPDKIVFFLSNLRGSSHYRNHHVVVDGGYAPTTHTSRSYASGEPHVAVGGGHAPTTHTSRSYASGEPHVAVGGGHAPTTHTTRSNAGGAPRVAVGGGHSPMTHTTLGGGGKTHVSVGGGHNPSQERTSDGRVPVGSRAKR